MTARPLDFDFPSMSESSHRTPWSIGEDEQERELRDELGRRRDLYPLLVVKGRFSQDEADRHILVWSEILEDVRVDALDFAAGWGVATEQRRAERLVLGVMWEEKVRELRRELAIRRSGYAALIGKGRLTTGDARVRMERVEAVHWRYWIQGLTWDDRLALIDDAAARCGAARDFTMACSEWYLAAIDAGARWAPPPLERSPGSASATWRFGYWPDGIDAWRHDVAVWRAVQQRDALDNAA